MITIKNIDDVKILGFDLIRRKARDYDNPVSDETLGAYVRGIVDLETEIYSLSEDQCKCLK
jgi:hypothetical protein